MSRSGYDDYDENWEKIPSITDESIVAALVALGVRPPAIAEMVVKAIIAGEIPGLGIYRRPGEW